MNVNFIGEEFHLHLWCPVSFPQSGCLPTCGCNSESPFKDKIWLFLNICTILSMTLESIFLQQILCNTLQSFENKKNDRKRLWNIGCVLKENLNKNQFPPSEGDVYKSLSKKRFRLHGIFNIINKGYLLLSQASGYIQSRTNLFL